MVTIVDIYFQVRVFETNIIFQRSLLNLVRYQTRSDRVSARIDLSSDSKYLFVLPQHLRNIPNSEPALIICWFAFNQKIFETVDQH